MNESLAISYRKNTNKELFKNIEETLNISYLQNYVPLYDKFFYITEHNYNSINLDPQYSIQYIKKNIDDTYAGLVKDDNNNEKEVPIFFKFCPILDPIKFLIGKYDITNQNLFDLPSINKNNCLEKVNDPNNSAYIDGFFSYLTSKILHNYDFIHGVDFFGSYIGIKQNFTINIEDDIEYISDSDFFHKHTPELFELNTKFHQNLLNFDTRKHKSKLNISDETTSINLSNLTDFEQLETIFINNDNSENNETPKLEYETSLHSKNSIRSNSSNCSSRTSITNCSETLSILSESSINTDEGQDEEDEEEEEEEEEEDEEEVNVIIKEFPVHLICLEKCTCTLDQLITTVNLNEEEWGSIVMQVLFMLITYQTVFSLTHNDLHTNNIMYVKTDKEYLYYKYNKQNYKVPTFGRIFKIIDFGRAIYKFHGNIICSDSFSLTGDAATQYNFEPYINNNKPRLEPNHSFDLCRLGCALYDFIIADDEDPKQLTGIYSIIVNWCFDDKDRNILYKTNGEERYPDFKLYKMIARTVHNHTPQNVINLPYFQRYFWKKNNKKNKIFNIDNLPTNV